MTHRMLIIDDAFNVQMLIEEALRGSGVEIRTATDGASGWEQVSEFLPDLVVLDLALPEMSGWEVLQRMRADPQTASIPVLVVTAHGQSAMAADVREAGAEAFLEKPFRPGDLRDIALKLMGVSPPA